MAERAPGDQRRVAILISGRGSNMRALIEQSSGYQVVLVASNKPQAPGLDYARGAGIPTWTWDSKGVAREEFEAALDRALRDHRVGTIALAGYMRLLSSRFVEQWGGRIVNIHPSLLPKYPGLDTHARAIAARDTVAGCSVHIVTEKVDAGKVLGQIEVAIEAGDDASALEQRVLEAEHRLYPKALREFVRQ
ncbi:phosphoribosylglycinamide formyltransferase [Sphingomonas sp.]|uniref:phosphoribosylglycinamide formyltransferase n=1 Tax=Sphingomonas sp. TaxID=28214 RepID=UPI00185407C0|nr:phosphoribosylglycinamide formyltransferase [Sphingomonas sp.]MBA3511313.1 phosphoribosylglycinamide formyltransferase [Sphingomonas sp.]